MNEAVVAPAPMEAGDGLADALLRVQALRAWYGESHVLHGVDFSVNAGEVVSLLGRNGAGKTTTLKCLMGMISRKAGSVRLKGSEILPLPPEAIAHLGMAICPEERGIFSSLNVRENLLLPPKLNKGGLDLAEIFAIFPNLQARLSSQGTRLSGGEQQMLAIARILRTGADLILLDEPTEGLAPVIVDQIGALIDRLKSRGYTILIVEQNIGFAARVADRHLLMEHGRIVERFSRADVGANAGLIQKYLAV